MRLVETADEAHTDFHDVTGHEQSSHEGTLRERLLDLLRQGPATARDLSGLMGLREREVLDHLEHLRRSLHHSPEQFVMKPAECRSCGYRFVKRDRLGRPGSCPRCTGQRISPPVFLVQVP